MIKLERIILNSLPIRFIIRKSKQLTLPGFQGLSLFQVVQFFIPQVNKVGLNERAAAISFNFIMAIPASAIFLFTLVPYLPISKQFTLQILELTKDITPNQNTYLLINDFLNDFFNRPRNALLSFGFLLAIFYSSNAMMGVIETFDKSIFQKKNTNFIKKRWKALKLTFILTFLIFGIVLILMGQDYLFKNLMHWIHIENKSVISIIKNLRWVFILLFFFYSIAFIYRYAPSVHKKWSLISPGTILATILTIGTTLIFSWWVNNFGNYNKIYGSIGTAMVIMLIIYFNSLILLIGFELNVSITKLKSDKEEIS